MAFVVVAFCGVALPVLGSSTPAVTAPPPAATPASPAATTAPPPAATPVSPPTPTLTFEGAGLSAADREAVAGLAAYLAANPSATLAMEVHCDGRVPAPQRLTDQRRRALEAAFKGYPVGGRIAIESAGANRPIADNATADGRRRNNRVVLRWGVAPSSSTSTSASGMDPAAMRAAAASLVASHEAFQARGGPALMALHAELVGLGTRFMAVSSPVEAALAAALKGGPTPATQEAVDAGSSAGWRFVHEDFSAAYWRVRNAEQGLAAERPEKAAYVEAVRRLDVTREVVKLWLERLGPFTKPVGGLSVERRRHLATLDAQRALLSLPVGVDGTAPPKPTKADDDDDE